MAEEKEKKKKSSSSRDKTKSSSSSREKDKSARKEKSRSSKDKKSSTRDKDRDKDREASAANNGDASPTKIKKSSSRSKSSEPRRSEGADRHGGGGGGGGSGSAYEGMGASPPPNPDFEAGLLFERYANGQKEGLNAQDFQRMWREHTEEGKAAARRKQQPSNLPLPPASLFDVGKLFERYNSGKDGKLSYDDFLRLVREEQYDFSDKKHQQQQQQAHSSFMPKRLEDPASGLPPPPARSTGRVDSDGAGGSSNYSNNTSRMMMMQQGVGDPNAYSYNGVHIGPPLTHYNETTGVPVPSDAVSSQQSLGHTVVPLSEAFERRVIRLQAMVANRLLPAREALLQVRRRLQNVAEETNMMCAAIERETMADTNAILERLRSADALKQAAIAQKIGNVSTKLRAIDKIAEKVACVVGFDGGGGSGDGGRPVVGGEKLFNTTATIGNAAIGSYVSPANRYRHELIGADRMVELIQSYGQLCTAIDKAGDEPIDNSSFLLGGVDDVDVMPEDFPRETAERLEVLRRADRYEKVLAVKDQLLWDLLQDNKQLEEQCKTEAKLSRDYAAETAEWVELTNRLTTELNAARESAASVPLLKEEIARLHEEKRALAAKVDRHFTPKQPQQRQTQPPAASSVTKAG